MKYPASQAHPTKPRITYVHFPTPIFGHLENHVERKLLANSPPRRKHAINNLPPSNLTRSGTPDREFVGYLQRLRSGVACISIQGVSRSFTSPANDRSSCEPNFIEAYTELKHPTGNEIAGGSWVTGRNQIMRRNNGPASTRAARKTRINVKSVSNESEVPRWPFNLGGPRNRKLSYGGVVG